MFNLINDHSLYESLIIIALKKDKDEEMMKGQTKKLVCYAITKIYLYLASKNIIMQKSILTFLAILITSLTYGQPETNATGKFYNSYQDYIDNKPIPEIDVYSIGLGSVEVKNNGIPEKLKDTKLPSAFFTNSNGMLVRVFEEYMYYVLVDGPLCYYLKRVEGIVSITPQGQFSYGRNFRDDVSFDYYSETISGEIKKLKDKVLDAYLEKNNLTAQYKSDKVQREASDTVDGYRSKHKNKTAKYIKLINKKMK